jgi:hypothetical protein
LAYLALVEVGKWAFYRAADRRPRRTLPRRRHRHLRRRVAYFTSHAPAEDLTTAR